MTSQLHQQPTQDLDEQLQQSPVKDELFAPIKPSGKSSSPLRIPLMLVLTPMLLTAIGWWPVLLLSSVVSLAQARITLESCAQCPSDTGTGDGLLRAANLALVDRVHR